LLKRKSEGFLRKRVSYEKGRGAQAMKRLMVLLGCICFILTYFFIQPQAASSSEVKYPTRPIKFIVIFSAGGGSDVTCRKLADLAGKYLGQEIYVENKPGAGGAVGVRFIAKSKPDGYTIGHLSASPVVIAPFFQEIDYDPTTDFTPIIQYGMADHPLGVPVDSPIKTFKDFIEEARKREITIAGTGNTAADYAMLRLAAAEGIKLRIVPFGGVSKSLPAVLGGHTDAIVSAGIYEHVRRGELRLIAQTTKIRNKEFPETPTLIELGHNIETAVFFGIIGPKDLPKPIQKKLEEAFTKAVHDPSFPQVIYNVAYTFFYRNAEDFGQYMKEAYGTSEKVFKELGLGRFAKEKK
jgi:tripartite-type tricarboxylate transporter receptor subunit TctC